MAATRTGRAAEASRTVAGARVAPAANAASASANRDRIALEANRLRTTSPNSRPSQPGRDPRRTRSMPRLRTPQALAPPQPVPVTTARTVATKPAVAIAAVVVAGAAAAETVVAARGVVRPATRPTWGQIRPPRPMPARPRPTPTTRRPTHAALSLMPRRRIRNPQQQTAARRLVPGAIADAEASAANAMATPMPQPRHKTQPSNR